LIVEDDFLVASQVQIALQDAGFEQADIASSADEAISIAATMRPVLAIMDVRLAGRRDGIDAALELFRDYGIRCIFATAHYDPDVRRRAHPAAPLGWLPKPYSMVSLVDMVRRVLGQL
jgi:DNA-binding NarL/FixJ family response regulator